MLKTVSLRVLLTVVLWLQVLKAVSLRMLLARVPQLLRVLVCAHLNSITMLIAPRRSS